jgi:hypothetical protein
LEFGGMVDGGQFDFRPGLDITGEFSGKSSGEDLCGWLVCEAFNHAQKIPDLIIFARAKNQIPSPITSDVTSNEIRVNIRRAAARVTARIQIAGYSATRMLRPYPPSGT